MGLPAPVRNHYLGPRPVESPAAERGRRGAPAPVYVMPLGRLMRGVILTVLALAGLSCRPTSPRETSPPANHATRASTQGTAAAAPRLDAAPGAPLGAAAPLPPVGLAVMDTLARWCAIFATDMLHPGQRVTLVAPEALEATAAIASRAAEIVGRRAAPCATAFAQPQFADSAAYDLTVLEAGGAEATALPSVMIAVGSEGPWGRDADGVVRADVDGDGHAEEARVCQADEGQHFTLWHGTPGGGPRRRWWHGYFDWGAAVEPTCSPDEAAGALAPGGTP